MLIRLVMLYGLLVFVFAGCQQSASRTAERPTLLQRLGAGGAFTANRTAANDSFFGQSQTSPQNLATNNQTQEFSELSQQIATLNRQLGNTDTDNQQLVTEIASLKQKLQVAADYNNQIRQQLVDNSAQLRQLQTEKQAVEQRLVQARDQFASTPAAAATGLIGGATVRSNNSLLQHFSSIQIPGGSARLDGDVIRIEFPSDVLFQPGTFQIRGDQTATLRSIVTTLGSYFPNQIVGIEAHWDGTPVNPAGTSHHQLTATQALSVFNQLVQLGLPADQLFTMALGSNRPRHPQTAAQNGTSPNRRIEIVVYPERYRAGQGG